MNEEGIYLVDAIDEYVLRVNEIEVRHQRWA
jgi:hypothetical protein